MALGSAFIWTTYSLLTRQMPPFPTAAVGLFCLVSGALAFASHLLLEPRYAPSAIQWWLISALALGPIGAAFFLWDAAIKRGDAHAIGALSYLTPLGSTLPLLAAGYGKPTWNMAVAAALIVGGARLGSLPLRRSRSHS